MLCGTQLHVALSELVQCEHRDTDVDDLHNRFEHDDTAHTHDTVHVGPRNDPVAPDETDEEEDLHVGAGARTPECRDGQRQQLQCTGALSGAPRGVREANGS
jgi:hypothetical protein